MANTNMSIENIGKKYVIFDTCLLIKSYHDLESFKNLFDKLKTLQCAGLYFPLIEFEFLRVAQDAEHRKKLENFLKTLNLEKLSLHPEQKIIETAINIANIYAARRSGEPDLVDCCTAAYLKEYDDKILLATLNHKHFPPCLFDLVHLEPVVTSKEMFPVAFYGFNKEKAKNLHLT